MLLLLQLRACGVGALVDVWSDDIPTLPGTGLYLKAVNCTRLYLTVSTH